MLSQTNHTAIKRFVQTTLGCACPDEVFAVVEYHVNTLISPDLPYSFKLLVGQRLLIYVLRGVTPQGIKSLLPIMFTKGRQERDEKGLNRFRAVIMTDRVDELEPDATELFKTLSDRDDKLHLHVLAGDEIEAIDALT
jgi:hypothetical protein